MHFFNKLIPYNVYKNTTVFDNPTVIKNKSVEFSNSIFKLI